MEAITLLIIISSIIYIIYDLTTEEIDENISRRLQEFSPETTGEETTKKQDEDSSEFIRNALRKIAQNVVSNSKNIVTQKQTLTEAGMATDDESFLNHMSKKLTNALFFGITGIVLAVITSVSPLNKLMMVIFFPIVGFRLPDIRIKRIAKKRSEEVTYTLADAIDLLSVCVEAGLGIDSAITRVAKEQEYSAPVLSSEFKRVGKDIVAGVSRSDALKALAKRNSSPELRSFVGLLIQSDKLGTSVSQSLKVYSDSLRIKRRQKAEELASKASIKMTIPLVLFILPATFIVILAPAVLGIMKTFYGGG